MRKVFMSITLLGEIRPTKYISEDFVLKERNYNFPLSYLIDNETVNGDNIEIITAVEHGESNTQTAVDNYAVYVQEVKDILADRQINLHFTEVEISKKFEDETFTRFFKRIAGLLQEDDEIFADFTFGMKVYSLSMFIALAYVVKAGVNIDLRCLMYSKKYSGTEKSENQGTSELCDITSLFYLDAIAGNAKSGQKQVFDEVLNLIIKEEAESR